MRGHSHARPAAPPARVDDWTCRRNDLERNSWTPLRSFATFALLRFRGIAVGPDGPPTSRPRRRQLRHRHRHAGRARHAERDGRRSRSARHHGRTAHDRVRRRRGARRAAARSHHDAHRPSCPARLRARPVRGGARRRGAGAGLRCAGRRARRGGLRGGSVHAAGCGHGRSVGAAGEARQRDGVRVPRFFGRQHRGAAHRHLGRRRVRLARDHARGRGGRGGGHGLDARRAAGAARGRTARPARLGRDRAASGAGRDDPRHGALGHRTVRPFHLHRAGDHGDRRERDGAGAALHVVRRLRLRRQPRRRAHHRPAGPAPSGARLARRHVRGVRALAPDPHVARGNRRRNRPVGPRVLRGEQRAAGSARRPLAAARAGIGGVLSDRRWARSSARS